MKVTLSIIVSLVFVSSCASTDRPTCDPGDQKECDCLGGVQGVQVCLQDGSGWDECECPCVENCAGRECGPGPVCEESCGDCTSPCTGEVDSTLCIDGLCDSICCPDCGERECGQDPVCGDNCGDCGANARAWIVAQIPPAERVGTTDVEVFVYPAVKPTRCVTNMAFVNAPTKPVGTLAVRMAKFVQRMRAARPIAGIGCAGRTPFAQRVVVTVLRDSNAYLMDSAFQLATIHPWIAQHPICQARESTGTGTPGASAVIVTMSIPRSTPEEAS